MLRPEFWINKNAKPGGGWDGGNISDNQERKTLLFGAYVSLFGGSDGVWGVGGGVVYPS